MENLNRCENCRHWDRVDPIDLVGAAETIFLDDESDEERTCIGRCRRYPPQLVPFPSALAEATEISRLAQMTEWPLTAGCESCGEFSPRPGAPIPM